MEVVPDAWAIAFMQAEDHGVLAHGKTLETWSLREGHLPGKAELGTRRRRLVPHLSWTRVAVEWIVDLDPFGKAFSIPPVSEQLFGEALGDDGRAAAACLSVEGAQYEVRLWDTSTGKELARRAVALPPLQMTFGAPSEVLWLGDADGAIVRWSWRAGTAERRAFGERLHAGAGTRPLCEVAGAPLLHGFRSRTCLRARTSSCGRTDGSSAHGRGKAPGRVLWRRSPVRDSAPR